MVGASWTGLMILYLAFSSGNDLVSVLDAKDYFESRKISMTFDKMAELATEAPTSGKAQISQLLALRYLAENADDVKKDKNFQKILDSVLLVAKRQKAQDLQGFAAEYAQRTAAALGAKMDPPKQTIPQNSIRQDALNWFPKDSTLVASMDLRFENPEAAKEIEKLRKMLVTMLPPATKQEMYNYIDMVGNVRLDRYSIAYKESQQFGGGEIYMRLSGKGDHDRLVDFIKKMANFGPGNNLKVEKVKSFRGKKITLISENNRPPVMGFVGNEDFFVVGFESGGGDSGKVAEKLLDIRRGKMPSVLTGELAPKIKKVSDKAVGMFVGKIPQEMRREFTQGPAGLTFQKFPAELTAELTREKKGLKLTASSSMDNADDAKQFVTTANGLIQMGIAQMQNPPPVGGPGFPNMNKLFQEMTDILKSIKVRAQGKDLKGEMIISDSFLGEYMGFGMGMFGVVGGGVAPPPPPAKQAVPDVKPENEEKPAPKKEGRLIPAQSPLMEGVSLTAAPLTLPAEVVPCRHEYTRAMPEGIPA